MLQNQKGSVLVVNSTSSSADTRTTRPRIAIVGAGYVGMYVAHQLQRKLSRNVAEITVIDPESYMTYQPFLPETAAGNLEPRHVVVSLRRLLRRCELINARVTAVDHAHRKLYFTSLAGEQRELNYHILVVCPGSIVRTLPIPGLAECGIGIKTVGEAVWLRNHVLTQLDIAASTGDPAVRERALTFIVVGGGYAGVETLAELEDLSRNVASYYTKNRWSKLAPTELRWVLVEATGRILPEVGEQMGRYTVELLRKRGIDVRLETRLDSVTDGVAKLSDGSIFPTSTLVWTAGVKASPMLRDTDLPLDERGRLRADAYLRVSGTTDVWTAGDCAAVPDLTGGEGAYCAPNAQHAIRQAKHLASNVAASLRGKKLKHYRHTYAGSVAGLGLHHGVAQIYGVKLSGFPAWLLHRTYHLAKMPTFNRKVRIMLDWTIGLFFKRDIVALGEIHEPRQEFLRATAESPQSVAALEPLEFAEPARSPFPEPTLAVTEPATPSKR